MSKNVMWKDLIKRAFVSVVGTALLVYILILWYQGDVIVSSEYESYNTMFYILILLGVSFFTVLHGIYPMQVKWHKTTLFVLGIFLILIGSNTYLVDDISQGIYIGDMVTLFGVCIVLFGSTGLLTIDKAKKKSEEKDVEIIEV